MSTESNRWITVKDTHYGSCHEKHDGSIIVTSMWDMNRGGLIWSVHFRGKPTDLEQTSTADPANLIGICKQLVSVAKQMAVVEKRYDLAATIRDLEKQIEYKPENT